MLWVDSTVVSKGFIHRRNHWWRFCYRFNNKLADYVVALNEDTPEIDVSFLDQPDYELNALGARGVGEIGLAGIAAAITNAVYHALAFGYH